MDETDGRSFRCLKIRGINPNIPDDDVRSAIIEKLEPFHQFVLRLVNNANVGRAAYLNFKYMDDAEAVFQQHSSITLFGNECKVVPIYQKSAAETNVMRSKSKDSKTYADGGKNYGTVEDYNEAPKKSRPKTPPRFLTKNSVKSRLQGLDRNKYSIDRHPERSCYSDVRDRGNQSQTFVFSHRGDPSGGNAPNRSLYIGSLDPAISELDLKDTFSKFGIVQNVDLHRGGASGNYAFVQFFNMDMARQAKSQMIGRYIGQTKPWFGYGNAVPTRCVWVGGIGPWTNVENLRSEFSQFGRVLRVVWPDNRDYAYVEFENVQESKEAVRELSGVLHGKQRLRLDFVDVGLIESKLNSDIRTVSSDSPYVNRGTRRSPDRRVSRTSEVPRRGGASRGRDRNERSPIARRPARRRSSERRRTPSSNCRSVSVDRSPLSNFGTAVGSPISNSSRGSRKRATRSRSVLSNSSSVDDSKRRRRSSSAHRPTSAEVTQPHDERTVVLKNPVDSATSGNNFVLANPVPRIAPPFTPLPPYSAPLYPPVLANPAFPPPPIPPRNYLLPPPAAPSMFAASCMALVPPPVGVVAPASAQSSFYLHDWPEQQQQRPNREQLYGEHLPSASAASKPIKPPSSVVTSFPKVWSGALVLKNGAFVIDLHLVSGSVVLVNSLLGSSTQTSNADCPVLKIAQRLRLDQPDKLDELERRLRQAGRAACSVLIATPAQAEVDDVSNVIQQRPLQSLVTYLCQKEVAAVVPLPSGSGIITKMTGVLHAFPPCTFAKKFLQREAPGIDDDCPAEDQLLVIVCESTVEHF